MRQIRVFAPVALALLLGALTPSAAIGQKPTLVQPGQRVRVHSALARSPELIGGVETVSADTLVIRTADGTGASKATAIPLAFVTQLEVSRGEHSKWLTGLGIGLAAGAATGAILGATSGDSWLFSKSDLALMGAVVVAPIGGFVGLIAGALTKSETWETVPIPRVGKAVGLGPQPRAAFGLTLTF